MKNLCVHIIALLLAPSLLLDPVACQASAGLPETIPACHFETSRGPQQRFEFDVIPDPVLSFGRRSYSADPTIWYYAAAGAQLLGTASNHATGSHQTVYLVDKEKSQEKGSDKGPGSLGG